MSGESSRDGAAAAGKREITPQDALAEALTPERNASPNPIRFFPSIRPLTAGGAIRDAVAGVQLAAMNIPQALGYTKIAGTPVVTGFYTLLFPLIAFAAFGSSRYLVVAADSATAAILAGGVSTLAPIGSAHYVELAGMVALMTAALLLIARLVKAGFLADFLSQTALVGFLTGVGFQVAIAVLGQMLGVNTTSRRTIVQFVEVVRQLSRVNLLALAVSAAVVISIFALRWISPKLPGSLVAVAGAITASVMWDFAGRGLAVIGPVAGGMPHFGLPHATWAEFEALVPISGSCFVMIVAQSAATARVYAQRNHEPLDEDADIVGLAAANTAAALSGTFVVNGSPTQTAMVESCGARSQIAQISTAVCVAIVLLFFTRPLQYLPRCALGAMVFVIAVHLIDIKGLRQIGAESPGEMWLAIGTAVVVVFVGVEQGIILAMVLSLLRVVHHSYHPHTAVLVQDGQGAWLLTPVQRGAVTEPGIVVYRFGAALFYANAGFFAEQVRTLVEPASPRVRWVIVDAGAITHVDYTAARMLIELHEDLKKEGVELALAHVESDLKPDLDRHHVTEALGPGQIFDTLRNALASIRLRQSQQ
jgi:MFS superfamily sulfate permease-like transporter